MQNCTSKYFKKLKTAIGYFITFFALGLLNVHYFSLTSEFVNCSVLTVKYCYIY